MATLAVAGISAVVGSGAGVAVNIALSVAALAASYVDQKYILPALFGSDDPASDAQVGNLKLSTTNPGAPRQKVYGRAAFVPGHFIWNQNQRARITTQGGGGKGSAAPQSISEKFADIGVAACDGPISAFLTAFANRQPFFGTEFNDVVYADHRLSFSVDVNTPSQGSPDGVLTTVDTYLLVSGIAGENTPPFSSVFSVGDLAIIEGALDENGEEHPLSAHRGPTGGYGESIKNGLYIVYFVSNTAANVPSMSLIPVGNQDVYGASNAPTNSAITMDPGTPDSPMIIRRVDDGLSGFTHDWCSLENDFNEPPAARETLGRYEWTMFNPNGRDVSGLGDGNNVGVDLMYYGYQGQDGSFQYNAAGETISSIHTVTDKSFSSDFNPSTRLVVGGQYDCHGFCDSSGVAIDEQVTCYIEQVRSYVDPFNGTTYYSISIAIPTDQYNAISNSGTTPVYLGNGQFPVGSAVTTGPGTVADTEVYQVAIANTDVIYPGVGQPAVPAKSGGNGVNNGALFGGHGHIGFCMVRSESYNFSYDTAGVGIEEQDASIYLGTEDHEEDDTFRANLIAENKLTSGQTAPTHRGLAHISFANLNLYQFGNIVPQVTFKINESTRRSVGQTVSKMFGIASLTDMVDASSLGNVEMFGYSFASGTTLKEAIQPLSMMYRFGMQERGGRVKILMDHELPFTAVPYRHLNASQWEPDRKTNEGLPTKSLDSESVPQRVVVEYLSIGNGNEEAESAGTREPGSVDEESKDTVKIQCRPVVAPQAFAKETAVRLLDKFQTESVNAATVLGPGYVDILPGSVIQTASGDWDTVSPDTILSDRFSLTNGLSPIIPGTVSVSLRFVTDEGTASESSESATITDDGNGEWTNIPDGITLNAASEVNYSTGYINFRIDTAGVTLHTVDGISIRYRFTRVREFRALKSTIGSFDHSNSLELVETIYDGVTPPYPHPPQVSLGRVPGVRAQLSVSELNLPALSGGQGTEFRVALDISPRTVSNSYAGGAVYESSDGISNWTLRDATSGYVKKFDLLNANTLSQYTPSNNVIARADWSTALIMINLTDGYTPTSASLTDVANGKNWVLLPDGEIIAFLEVVAAGPAYVISGIIRGLRGTASRAWLAKQATETGCVVVPEVGLDAAEGVATWTTGSAVGSSSRTTYIKAVPPGVSIDDVDAVELELSGRTTLPPAPIWTAATDGATQAVTKVGTDDISISWAMGMFDEAPLFGQSSMPFSYERYEVFIWPVNEAADRAPLDGQIEENAVRKVVIGSGTSGMSNTVKSYTYTAANQLLDGLTASDEIGISVRQVGPTGPGYFALPSTITVTAT